MKGNYTATSTSTNKHQCISIRVVNNPDYIAMQYLKKVIKEYLHNIEDDK